MMEEIEENVDTGLTDYSVLIKSNGNSYDTEVFVNGEKLKNVLSVEIGKIDIENNVLKAKIEVAVPRIYLKVKEPEFINIEVDNLIEK